MAVQVTQISMAPGDCMTPVKQHGFRHRPWTSLWTSVVTETSTQTLAAGCRRTTDFHMALIGSTGPKISMVHVTIIVYF